MLEATDKAYATLVEHLTSDGERDAFTGRTLSVSPETVERGSRKITEQPLPLWASFKRAWKAFRQGLEIGRLGFLYQWRKSRKRRIPFSARVTVTDPIVRVAQEEGIELPEDDPHIVLYRTEKGVYFTDSHMEDGAWCAKHLKGTATFACDISQERAAALVEQLDALEMDSILKPEDQHLRDVLRRLLAEKDVY